MKIRIAVHTDILQLTELKKPKTEGYRKKFAENQTKRLQEMDSGRAIYLIAEEDNQIIGHVFVKFYGSQTEPDYPNVQDLYVDEKQRNKGIGTQLIQEAERLAKEKGYKAISLAVNPTLNQQAKELYEKLGYKRTATEPYVDGVYNGVEDWCVDMVKDLI